MAVVVPTQIVELCGVRVKLGFGLIITVAVSVDKHVFLLTVKTYVFVIGEFVAFTPVTVGFDIADELKLVAGDQLYP